jgi:hypothetical protein
MSNPSPTFAPLRGGRLYLPALIGVLLTALPLCGASQTGQPVAGGPNANWWSQVQRRIAASEYHVSWQERTVLNGLDAAWQAPNRAHDFRTYFTPRGIRLIPRRDSAPAWEWSLRLVGYGREGAVRWIGPAELFASRNRIDYDRDDVGEWYVNDERGLKQGFTLQTEPDHITRGGDALPVQLELALGGDLAPLISADGQAVDFVTPSGARVLRYAALEVWDATGRELAARIEGFSRHGLRGIRLVVDDERAVYPVTVDPLATSASWSADGGQQDAWFAASVATAGDVNRDGFSDLIVGAPRFDNGAAGEGRAFVFHGSAAGPSLLPDWSAEGEEADANFGISVATAGDVNGDDYADVIVGADGAISSDGEREGAAFAYHGADTGLSTAFDWRVESELLDPVTEDKFGISVGPAGDVNGDGYSDVVIGAPGSRNVFDEEGAAYIHFGSSSGLSLTPDWTRFGGSVDARFGEAVATAGDVNGDGWADLIVGAPRFDNGASDEGAAFVFHGSSSGPSLVAAWVVEGETVGARLGRSVATAGDVNGDGYADVIVGADQLGAATANEGGARVYRGSASGLSDSEAWTVQGSQSSENVGASVATAGDVNGDGYADVIVGSPGYDGAVDDLGRALVYFGSAAGLSPGANWSVESDQALSEFGRSVATAGDVNGDGFSEVIVGARAYDNGEPGEGRAFVYDGSAAGLSPLAAWTTESDQEFAQLGRSLSTAGDVNGDGYADVIVGTYLFDGGEDEQGRVFVHHGSPGGLSTAPDWVVDGDRAEGLFGYSVSTAGDVNGDGFSDVIIGAAFHDNGELDEGRAFVYEGSASGLSTVAAWSAEGEQEDALFGSSVASAGDVNGDGYSDVVVGAVLYDTIDFDEGRAFVYHGSAAGLSTMANWAVDSGQAGSSFGGSVGTAGDVDGDGFSDVIVGAYRYDNVEFDEDGRRRGRRRFFRRHRRLPPLRQRRVRRGESLRLSGFADRAVADRGLDRGG